MSINSTTFLLFLAVSVVAYYLIPQKYRYLVLLTASVVFYLAYSVWAAAYLLVTILITYGCGLLLGDLHRRERIALEGENADGKAIKLKGKHRRRMVLAIVLTLNFATLSVFKYLDSWLGGLGSLMGFLGIHITFRPLDLLLPLGISFYIFQTSGYVIDVYRGRLAPERSFLKYALFVCYFPQMIQGPINRFDKLQPQLTEGNSFDANNLKYGIQLMLWGMLKKAFLADPLADAVGEIYSNFSSYSGATVLLGVMLYCIQLYCDFSGGTDLVRGASQLFGIQMGENFCRPYFARSMDEFWRRWHISLGEWMKDYLFYPMALSGKLSRAGKKARRWFGTYIGKLVAPCLSTVVVFLVVGIWQGPGWSNIAYGLWNGGLISLAMLCSRPNAGVKKKLGISDNACWFHGIQIARTCILVIIGRYFSRSGSAMQAVRMLWRTIRHFGQGGLGVETFTGFGLTGSSWIKILLAGAVLLLVSILQEKGIPIRKTLDKKHWSIQFILLFVAILLLLISVYLNTDYTAIMYIYENV